MKQLFTVAIGLGLAAWPAAAQACAVCFTGKDDDTRIAFIVTTGFMTALPLLLIGGTIYYLVRRTRRLQAEFDADRAREAATAEPREVATALR